MKYYKITEDQLREYIGLLEQKLRAYQFKFTLSIPSIFKKRMKDDINKLRSKLPKFIEVTPPPIEKKAPPNSKHPSSPK